MGKGISYSVEQTLVGGNKSPQDVCEGGYYFPLIQDYVNGVSLVKDEMQNSDIFHRLFAQLNAECWKFEDAPPKE